MMALTHIGMMNPDSYQAPLANRKQGDERDAIIPAAKVIPRRLVLWSGPYHLPALWIGFNYYGIIGAYIRYQVRSGKGTMIFVYV